LPPRGDLNLRGISYFAFLGCTVSNYTSYNRLYSQQYAMVVQNTYNAGHFIGMTYRVKNDDSSVLSEDEIRNDIINDARTIQSLIKVAPKYVRLHYTNVEDTKTENILKELGMILVGYNLDSQDYSKSAKAQDVYKTTFQKQKETYDAKGSFISIQYDIPDTSSLESISYILNTINDEGYTMVRMDGCLNDPKPYRIGMIVFL
jgi:peptidoglycan/xylan/chitin deacetylase (PgdA/CDA1 family)